MQDLKKAFESLPVKNVETFIASGNVIFEAAVKDPSTLERKVESCLKKAFGYEVATFLRSIDQVVEIAGRKAFPPSALSHGPELYVGFMSACPGAAECKKLKSFVTEVHDFHVAGREVHWLIRKELAGPRFEGPPFEKILGMQATFRNVRTVERIAKKFA